MPQDSIETRAHEALNVMALAMTLLCLWALIYNYGGLAYDAQLYAVQAMSKLRPSLAADLFLQNVSQDHFTVFPRFYAWVINVAGLRPAALLLTIIFTICLLSSSWLLIATLTDQDVAWLATFLLIVVEGHYGAFGVFYISEPFLTARLPAEALISTALVCHVRGHTRIGVGIALAAVLVHPLMALPGLLLLICLRSPPRARVIAAGILIFGTLIASTAATNLSSVGRILPIMDGSWAHVVRERSQFLFLQLWRTKDWALNARPFLSLGFVALTLPAGSTRNLAVSGATIGATGIAISAIGCLVGPVAPLIQGQSWRWEWVTVLLSLLLVLPAARVTLQNGKVGIVCAILLIAGWLLSAVVGAACISVALLIWVARQKIPASWTKFGPAASATIAVLLVSCALISSWKSVSTVPAVVAGESYILACIRAVFESKILGASFAGALWWSIKSSSGPLRPATMFVLLTPFAVSLLLHSSGHLRPYGSPANIGEFADWRYRIPLESTIFVTNGLDSGSFVWFTLQRNNYLSPSQSAGVVFSRATALEVQRRSEVLLPINAPNWKILTSLRDLSGAASHSGDSSTSGVAGSEAAGGAKTRTFRALTARALIEVCRDTLLGFVVSPDNVGFGPITHTHPGLWHNWNLYDCRQVRSQVHPP
jgi:hypothetical protein